MLQTINASLQFGKRVLFDEVNIKFVKGNCYGIIGANGSGKSTFLKILSGEIEPTKGDIAIDKKERISVLAQSQNAYDNLTILDTVIHGNKRLVEIMIEKEKLYAKADFSDADGLRAGELEEEFTELNGWDADSDAKKLLQSMGVPEEIYENFMGDTDSKIKVKILLAQALFGNPDILILDEPTNNLDINTIRWLENFLLDFENTVIVVSHNRYFLNKVCTHICDIDYSKIIITAGNYDFWYESNQLIRKQQLEQNKKMEARATELKEFIARFSANASKSKQATSRKKELEKLTIADIKPSSRKYPYIDFKYEKSIGGEILAVENLSKKGYFTDVSFVMKKEDKIAFVSDNSLSISMLFDVLTGKEDADSGKFNWGKTVNIGYIPHNNESFFAGCNLTLANWVKQFSKDTDETYVRSWLGRMLFSGDEALKKACVLSGGEKVRCMLAKAMLESANFLIFDEPTNHLDLESITSLNKGMINFKSNMLFATHDRQIMDTVGNRLIVINNTIVYDKYTTYDEYLEEDN